MKKRALFIDRDGVINHMIEDQTEGFDSPQSISDVRLVDDIVEVISFCNNHDIPVIEISNQPGVAKGKMSLEQLDAVEKRVHDLLLVNGAQIDTTYRCLHHPNAVVESYKVLCDCRKPKPGLFFQATSELDIGLSESVFLGDKVSDMEAGIAAGCKTLFFSHENDTPEKVAKNRVYNSSPKVINHKETLEFVIKFFS